MSIFDDWWGSDSKSSLGSQSMDNYARESITPSFQQNTQQNSWSDIAKQLLQSRLQSQNGRMANNYSMTANPGLPQVQSNPLFAQMMQQNQQNGSRPVFNSLPWSATNQTQMMPRTGGQSGDLNGLIGFLSANQAPIMQAPQQQQDSEYGKGLIGGLIKKYISE